MFWRSLHPQEECKISRSSVHSFPFGSVLSFLLRYFQFRHPPLPPRLNHVYWLIVPSFACCPERMRIWKKDSEGKISPNHPQRERKEAPCTENSGNKCNQKKKKKKEEKPYPSLCSSQTRHPTPQKNAQMFSEPWTTEEKVDVFGDIVNMNNPSKSYPPIRGALMFVHRAPFLASSDQSVPLYHDSIKSWNIFHSTSSVTALVLRRTVVDNRVGECE